jgi:predicted transcriptional regulator of viral defense system
MGKVIHLNKLREFLKITPIFRAKDVELIIKNKSYSYLTLHNLVKKGEIKRITKGWYSLYEDPIVAVFCFKPAYIGLQEALSIHELWEQETNVVIVTTRKIRSGVRKVLDSNVILHRIEPKYFFGFDYLKYENFFIPVSDVEKTLIDLVYFNEIPGKDVLKEIKKHVNEEKLKDYLKNFPPNFSKKVLHFFNKCV